MARSLRVVGDKADGCGSASGSFGAGTHDNQDFYSLAQWILSDLYFALHIHGKRSVSLPRPNKYGFKAPVEYDYIGPTPLNLLTCLKKYMNNHVSELLFASLVNKIRLAKSLAPVLLEQRGSIKPSWKINKDYS